MITVVAVRGCAERALVARLLGRCSPGSVRARLFFPEGRALGPDVLDLLSGPADGVGYVALDDDRPIGLANMVPACAAHPGEGPVEFALLVADRWRRRGIGRLLLRHAMTDPHWRGRAVTATVQPDNRAVLRLLRAEGLAPHLVDTAPGELYFELRPAGEPPLSVAS